MEAHYSQAHKKVDKSATHNGEIIFPPLSIPKVLEPNDSKKKP